MGFLETFFGFPPPFRQKLAQTKKLFTIASVFDLKKFLATPLSLPLCHKIFFLYDGVTKSQTLLPLNAGSHE